MLDEVRQVERLPGVLHPSDREDAELEPEEPQGCQAEQERRRRDPEERDARQPEIQLGVLAQRRDDPERDADRDPDEAARSA